MLNLLRYKIELLPWGGWGINNKWGEEISRDEIAFSSADDAPEIEQGRLLHDNDVRLRVTGKIRSYSQTGGMEIALAGL